MTVAEFVKLKELRNLFIHRESKRASKNDKNDEEID